MKIFLTDKLAAIEKSAVKPEESKYQCPDCDFITNSKQGLKVHQKRKHTIYI